LGEASGFADRRLARLDAGMQRFVDQAKFAGILSLVWRRGEVVHVHKAGLMDLESGAPMRRDAIFRLYSMTKPIISAAVMILVEEGRLRLYDPVGKWLPEAAGTRVLRTPDSEIDDTVPALRAPTLYELMLHTGGYCHITAGQPDAPISRAFADAAGARMPFTPHDADTLVQRLGALPLLLQPGARWHYGMATDLLGVVIARVSGQKLGDFLAERIFGPLGMKDTGFTVAADKAERLATGYMRDAEGRLVVHDDPRASAWARPPAFESGGMGLVSTIDDYLAFARMLLGGGQLHGERVLSRHAVRQMTVNHLKPEQIAPLYPTINPLRGRGFGLGLEVVPAADAVLGSEGRYGWPGAYATTWFADPKEDLIGLSMGQVWYDAQLELRPTFETLVYQALD
jgi:CubicO group peptidase (beta-lactamase class C family)